MPLKRLGTRRVWWLVTPGNPLKDTRGSAALGTRWLRRRRWPSSAHRRQRSRGRHRHALHHRHHRLSARQLPACASSGSWAPTISRSSIAGRTGADRRRGADRGDRPARPTVSGRLLRRPRRRLRATASPEGRRRPVGRCTARRPGRSSRAEIAVVLDRAAEPDGNVDGRHLTKHEAAASLEY